VFARLATVILLPLLLASCVLAPGKFTSVLTINADRSFAFSYVGEVYGEDGEQSSSSMASDKSDKPSPAEIAKKKADADTKNRALAAALSKEAGYKRVTYLGAGKFLIDYAASGTLNHAFLWPYNLDAEVLVPFVAVELRSGGVVRVKAAAFGNESAKSMTAMPMMPNIGEAMSNRLDGVFTLDTDAAIISQNNEDGASEVADRKIIVWKATPQSSAAPTAVLRMAR